MSAAIIRRRAADGIGYQQARGGHGLFVYSCDACGRTVPYHHGSQLQPTHSNGRGTCPQVRVFNAMIRTQRAEVSE